jgi:hypothetical protein
MDGLHKIRGSCIDGIGANIQTSPSRNDYQRYFTVRSPGDLWFLVNAIDQCGTMISPRGLQTKELRNIIVEVSPECNFVGPAPDSISEECKQFYIKDLRFANMRVTHALHKTEFEMNKTIELLRDHPSTRRARIIECDYAPYNIPCIQSTQFFRRDGQLCCSMFLRSSDTIKVLPLDIYLAQKLQEHILGSKPGDTDGKPLRKDVDIFNLPRGPVTCLISSSHVYIDDMV